MYTRIPLQDRLDQPRQQGGENREEGTDQGEESDETNTPQHSWGAQVVTLATGLVWPHLGQDYIM